MAAVRPSAALLLAAALAGPAAAGLYHPADPAPIPVGPDGTAAELSFGHPPDGAFPQRFVTLLNVADASPARSGPDRRAVLDRIAAARKRPDPSPAEAAGLAADLIRAGDPAAAADLLEPLARSRRPDFRVLANLAHLHAVRGDWAEAVRRHADALDLADFPADLTADPAQRAWLREVEHTHYRRWLTAHRDRADLRPDAEGVFPLFAGVRWAGAGELADDSGPLPPDAVPVVQQLLLWAPWDTPLFWLLGELYAARGRVREAAYIFDRCAESRQYSNRPVFMAHRAAVRAAAAALPPPTAPAFELPPEPPPAVPPADPTAGLPSAGRVAAVGAGFAVLVGLVAVLRARAARR